MHFLTRFRFEEQVVGHGEISTFLTTGIVVIPHIFFHHLTLECLNGATVIGLLFAWSDNGHQQVVMALQGGGKSLHIWEQMFICRRDKLSYGVDEVLTCGSSGQNAALTDIGLKIEQAFIVLVVAHRNQPLVISQCFYLVEMEAATIVGGCVAMQNLHHGRPTVQGIVQHRTGPGIVRIAQHLLWQAVVQVALFG